MNSCLVRICRVVLPAAMALVATGCQDTRLIEAVSTRDHATTKELIDRKVDLNQPDGTGRTALHHAILSRNRYAYLQLLEAGADPNRCDREGTSIMHLAAEQTDLFWVREAFRHGGDLNRDNVGNRYFPQTTPLFYALFHGRSETALELIHLGADINHLNAHRVSPVSTAMGIGLYKTITTMIQLGADPKLGTATIFDDGFLINDSESLIRDETRRNDYLELKQLLIERGYLELERGRGG